MGEASFSRTNRTKRNVRPILAQFTSSSTSVRFLFPQITNNVRLAAVRLRFSRGIH
ncbi:unnamed protein product [Acanthoscelides obtectus]|uniref:Uncharacterized protein n=1 Tax=Acanthoscelides obtectus TaxID=200917 RepID=A0A9P0M7I2_ACAOB|nr:unnamed protein product [Acanthoscelides obtectus]CAK1664319.1 hypothetical protein AOBTE_LOCUS24194 [Acanthoscelides obtectus]